MAAIPHTVSSAFRYTHDPTDASLEIVDLAAAQQYVMHMCTSCEIAVHQNVSPAAFDIITRVADKLHVWIPENETSIYVRNNVHLGTWLVRLCLYDRREKLRAVWMSAEHICRLVCRMFQHDRARLESHAVWSLLPTVLRGCALLLGLTSPEKTVRPALFFLLPDVFTSHLYKLAMFIDAYDNVTAQDMTPDAWAVAVFSLFRWRFFGRPRLLEPGYFALFMAYLVSDNCNGPAALQTLFGVPSLDQPQYENARALQAQRAFLWAGFAQVYQHELADLKALARDCRFMIARIVHKLPPEEEIYTDAHSFFVQACAAGTIVHTSNVLYDMNTEIDDDDDPRLHNGNMATLLHASRDEDRCSARDAVGMNMCRSTACSLASVLHTLQLYANFLEAERVERAVVQQFGVSLYDYVDHLDAVIACRIVENCSAAQLATTLEIAGVPRELTILTSFFSDKLHNMCAVMIVERSSLPVVDAFLSSLYCRYPLCWPDQLSSFAVMPAFLSFAHAVMNVRSADTAEALQFALSHALGLGARDSHSGASLAQVITLCVNALAKSWDRNIQPDFVELAASCALQLCDPILLDDAGAIRRAVRAAVPGRNGDGNKAYSAAGCLVPPAQPLRLNITDPVAQTVNRQLLRLGRAVWGTVLDGADDEPYFPRETWTFHQIQAALEEYGFDHALHTLPRTLECHVFALLRNVFHLLECCARGSTGVVWQTSVDVAPALPPLRSGDNLHDSHAVVFVLKEMRPRISPCLADVLRAHTDVFEPARLQQWVPNADTCEREASRCRLVQQHAARKRKSIAAVAQPQRAQERDALDYVPYSPNAESMKVAYASGARTQARRMEPVGKTVCLGALDDESYDYAAEEQKMAKRMRSYNTRIPAADEDDEEEEDHDGPPDETEQWFLGSGKDGVPEIDENALRSLLAKHGSQGNNTLAQ